MYSTSTIETASNAASGKTLRSSVENSTPGRAIRARRRDLGAIVVDPVQLSARGGTGRLASRLMSRPWPQPTSSTAPVVGNRSVSGAERAGQGAHRDMQPRRQPGSPR
ncbi:MAG: hypothetical protein MZU91_07380 [Desulfosudis oleivorans]|nr:hypothetical protein [Desulfosudis oleivorans]